MGRRFPLSAKIVLWFFLNLGLLAALFCGIVGAQFHFGPDWLLSSSANDRIDSVSDLITADLAAKPQSEWDAALKVFDDSYHDKVRFLVFGEGGRQLAGEPLALPEEIRHRLMMRPPRPRDEPPPVGDGTQPPPRHPQFDSPPKSMIHTSDPSRFWVVVRTAITKSGQGHPEPLALVIVSDTLAGGGLFFDVGPWISLGLAAIAVSTLLWFPLVRGINRSIAQMTDATRHIAAGRFETRVEEARSDELGTLGGSINQMAERLAGLVGGQKRFLGDVAHELCSPLARLRVCLGILEQRADGELKDYAAKAETEAAHMAALVNELLSFSKASLAGPVAKLDAVNVRDIIEKTALRETSDAHAVQVNAAPDLFASADAELLSRALGNLLRNSLRYAGAEGPISIHARDNGDAIEIAVADRGPGVKAEDLPRIFDPFFRVDASRDRATGGVGLGLAIVKTCVEACGGSVSCRNVEPSGLETTITLKRVSDKN